MKNLILATGLAISTLMILPASSHAEVGAFGIVPPHLQTPVENSTIRGSRFSLGWARHRKVVGFDLGIIGNITTTTFIGTGISFVFNETRGDTYIFPLQIGLIWNRNSGDSYVAGLQASLGVNSNGKSARIFGLQIAGLANLGNNDIYGIQASLYNVARKVYGFQIGLINKTQELHGFQIGLINIHTKGFLTFFPVLNASF